MLAEKHTRVDPEFSAAPDSAELTGSTGPAGSAPVSHDESPALTRALRGLPPALRSIIAHPDYAAARQDPHFFDNGPACFHSPLLIPGMEEAVDILRATVESKGRMLVLGDRDVDGVSSTALLGNFLRERHEKKGGGLELVVSDDGDDYGLSGDLFDRIREGDADLVILLDMGSSHGPEVNQLLERGKRVIILDHHQLHDRIPDADLEGLAFVNPCRDADVVCALEHDGKIATVGLVFKLLLAYGLSFTKEWQRAFYYEDTAAGGGAAVSAYRCGCFLGRFEDLAAGQAAFPELEWCPLTESYALASGDLEFFRAGADADRQAFDQRGLIAGKVVLGYMIRSRPRLLEFVQRSADLAAVGIITDMVPLVGENRALVRLGIGQSGFDRRGERPYSPGYEALIGALGLPVDRIVSRDLSWSIGPALNAAGRMGNTRLALDLLTCEDPEEARRLAKDLVKLNEDRKKRTARNETVVARHFEAQPELLDRPILFCYHEDLEPGVSGIVATRLVERHHKPVVYINRDGKHAKGSTRTHNGLNVLKLLDQAADLFVQFGGHPEAAGFSIHYDRIPELERALQAAAPAVLAEHAAQIEERSKAADPDDAFHLELRPADLGYELLRDVELLEPFGSGNPEPVFCLRDVHPAKIKYMTDGLHARFGLRGAPAHVDCVAWRLGARIAEAAARKLPLTLYGSLEMSYFAGRSRLQFRVERLKTDGGQEPTFF